MKKLLIPVDFSETSEAAIVFGIELAEKCNYHIMLHHSVDMMQSYESMYVDVPHAQAFTKQLLDDVEVKMENLWKRYKKDHLLITKHVTSGSLIQDIRFLVKDQGVDIIVMGTKGASGFKEFFIGSNTEKVVRLVDCPVISIPREIDLKSVRKILIPINLSEIRVGFLREVSVLQQLFSAAVELVWVKTPHDVENVDLISEEVNNLLSEYEIASSSFTIIKDVFPQDGILKYARSAEVDMIAMSTHARRGLAHWFTGSLTEDVINHSSIPLWSVKIDENDKIINLETYQEIHSDDLS